MAIGGYSIGGYWWLLVVIGGYWCLLYWWLFLVILGYITTTGGYYIINYCWIFQVILLQAIINYFPQAIVAYYMLLYLRSLYFILNYYTQDKIIYNNIK